MSKLARLLDLPFLARVVPHLPPETLQQLIRHQGLDACADLVALATPAQLTSLLDLDLWHHAQRRGDEEFDVERFGEWIEALIDAGDSLAARTIAALDHNLIVAGLSRYVRVFDPGIFEPTAQSDDEATDRHEAMREGDVIGVDDPVQGDALTCEIGGYIVRARRGDAWDAMVALLHALATEHADYFHAVAQGCRRLSNSRPEVDGLADLLMEPEQHLHEVAVEREQRRSEQGYTTPADARAFLEMARHRRSSPAPATQRLQPSHNPIAAAYFRAIAQQPAAISPRIDEDVSSSIVAVTKVLSEAGVLVTTPRALLESEGAHPETLRLMRLRQLMAHVRDMDAALYSRRSHELAFLANVLIAGCSVQSRSFTPREASDAAASICNLGVGNISTESYLVEHDLVAAFEAGWSVLYRDVSLFVAQELIATLDHVHCTDGDIQRDLVTLRRTLVKNVDAGTPWLAREAADALSMLDVTASIGVAGLLEECPVMPAALTAILEGRTTTVSATEFEFIYSVAQIDDVRLFMGKLRDVLTR